MKTGPSERQVPLALPWLGEEEEREILETLRSGWLTTGPRTREFERRFAEYVGCRQAIGVNSCTSGLHLSLVALGVGPGDEVITSPITFAATANVIVHQGAKPVFADVDPETLNVDPAEIERRITPRTKVVMPVHLFGQPCGMEAILAAARRHGVAVVEDAAHAIGAEYRGRKIGSFGDLTVFSFYATKNITTGEGGMLTTNRDDLAEKARILSNHGISADAWRRRGEGEFAHWDVILPGYKYNMFDIQAALGLEQLKKIEAFWERRKAWVAMYNKAFREIPEIRLVAEREEVKHAYHLYAVILKTEDLAVGRDEILQALRNAGIGVGVHFRALHLTSFYRKTFDFKSGDLPNAEYAGDRVISLPLYPRMEEEDVKRVIAAVKQTLHRFRKKRSG